MKLKFTRRIAAITAAAATVAAAVLTGGGATALPSGNYVAFGDSFPANPGNSDPSEIGAGGCPQSVSNVSRKVAHKTGLLLHDYSCNGSVVYMPNDPIKMLNSQVDRAIANGHLNHETQMVTFFLGANDAMQAFWAPNQIQDELFNRAMVDAINKVKHTNPTARIMLVGYPEITSRDNVHFACPINAFGFAPQIPAAPVHTIEMTLQARQQRAAAETGAGFINMKDISNIHVAMCGRDGERQVSAILDSDTSQYNMTNHLTFRGTDVFSDIIANVYRSTF